MSNCCINLAFCCIRIYNRLFYKKLPKQKISTSNLPWLWIGVELENGNIETITDIVNTAIEPGQLITPYYLKNLTGYRNAKRWLYLDATTLNEEEFPATGLVIADDSGE